MVEKVLSFDLSTKTGWAYLISSPAGLKLEDYGQLPQMSEPTHVPYPESYVEWAQTIFAFISGLVEKFVPDVVVIEETAAGSKSNFSQKILEFIHYLVAEFLTTRGTKTKYFLTEEWRRICGCKMTKEESKRNKEVRDYKKKHKARLARDKDNKIVGRIGRKHVNVRRANEIFEKYLREPLRKRDEDSADALLLGAAYHFQKSAPEPRNLKELRNGLKTA